MENNEQEPRRGRDPLADLEARVDAAIEEVRPKMKRALEELDARVDAAMREIRPRVESAVDDVRPRVERFIADIQPRLDSVLQRIEARIADLRKDLETRAAGPERSGTPVALPRTGEAEGERSPGDATTEDPETPPGTSGGPGTERGGPGV